jgi:hypothetical protein
VKRLRLRFSGHFEILLIIEDKLKEKVVNLKDYN